MAKRLTSLLAARTRDRRVAARQRHLVGPLPPPGTPPRRYEPLSPVRLRRAFDARRVRPAAGDVPRVRAGGRVARLNFRGSVADTPLGVRPRPPGVLSSRTSL